jgi:methylthioribose-1-phosphate isomerase
LTEPLDPPAEEGRSPLPEPGGADEDADLGRRRFFRQFAGELFQGAATIVGAAQVLQKASAEAAGAILDPAAVAARTDTDGLVAPPTASAVPSGFRTPFREDGDILYIIDQRKLPDVLEEYPVKSAAQATFAIREMIVRGAPAIGSVAAIGLALTAANVRMTKPYARRATLRGAANALRNARPTTINLHAAVDRLMAAYAAVGELSEDGGAIATAMRAEADTIVFEATDDHGRLAAFGLDALPFPPGDDRPLQLLTHGNTGPLGSGQFGTALGIVQAAHNADRAIHVWVGETRPYLHGARLTTWELAQAGVPHTLVLDGAAGSLMAAGRVDVVVVGADRVAANGDTANEIGTYPLAVLAARHGIPFYVAAPISSIDLATSTGDGIPIEQRGAGEVVTIRGQRVAPPGTDVHNPVVDVTPAALIAGILTEEGVVRAPFTDGLAAAVARRAERRAHAPAFVAVASSR